MTPAHKTWLSATLFTLLLGLSFLNFSEFRIGVNTTESINHTYFIMHLGSSHPLKLNDYIAFQTSTCGVLPNETVFIKQIAGVAGDRVTHRSGKVFINDQEIGEIKQRTKTGKLLWPGYVGKIPEEFYFVYTPHPRSFDSRYSQMGLIHESEIIARAYPLL